MKNSYVNNIPIVHGEVTIVINDNAVNLMKNSCKLARSVQEAGVGSLLINCGLSERRFRKHIGYPEESKPKTHLLVKNSEKGNLIGDRVEIDQAIAECDVRVIIISGWEWTSASYRRKERLLFYLREIMSERKVAVIIFSQTTTKPVIGKIDRAGLGKLPTFAIAIVAGEMSEALDAVSPKPPPIVIHSAEERRAAEESAQLLISKINMLQPLKPPIAAKRKLVRN